MIETPVCASCGRAVVGDRCPSCSTERWASLVHREIVLLAALVAITVAAFFVTRAAARSNDDMRRRQAAAWFEAGERAAATGDADGATVALRRAVSKTPGNRRYRLALAEALAAGGADQEARRLLLALRELQPEDPAVNLQLARLERRGVDGDGVRRYYQSALMGLWRPEQAEDRRRVRVELVEFLLAAGQRARALSELLVLAAGLPEDSHVRTRVGRMFLAAGDPRLALEYFTSAVELDSTNREAFAGAGEAAFGLGDYARAIRYLRRAPPEDARAADLRHVVQLVFESDPLAPRLGLAERRRRLAVGLEQAMRRLDGCIASTAGQADDVEALRREARDFQEAVARPRRPDPREIVDEGLDLVYRLERTADARCASPPESLDRALLLIARRYGFEQP